MPAPNPRVQPFLLGLSLVLPSAGTPLRHFGNWGCSSSSPVIGLHASIRLHDYRVPAGEAPRNWNDGGRCGGMSPTAVWYDPLLIGQICDSSGSSLGHCDRHAKRGGRKQIRKPHKLGWLTFHVCEAVPGQSLK